MAEVLIKMFPLILLDLSSSLTKESIKRNQSGIEKSQSLKQIIQKNNEFYKDLRIGGTNSQ